MNILDEPDPHRLWPARILLSALVVIAYFFSEWLFFLTKPSSLSSSPWTVQWLVFAIAPVWPVLFVCAFVLLFLWFAGVSRRPFFRMLWLGFSLLIPAVVLAGILFLLIDNFTITIFDWGIRSLQFPATIPYLVLLIALAVLAFYWLRRWENRLIERFSRRTVLGSVTLLLAILILFGAAGYVISRNELPSRAGDSRPEEDYPSILLIGSDGLNADHLSVYGYSKDTTPSISRFATQALIFENAYANASRTQASLTSLLSGKLPTTTRLICSPDILHGQDVYRHLPGILKQHGYRSIQLTVRGYGDAYDANMRRAFDSVNFRGTDETIVLKITQGWMIGEASFFLHQVYERIYERLLHITGIRELSDPFAEVMGIKRETFSDSRKLNALLDFIDASKRPFFAHIHFMGTHRNRMKDQAAEPSSPAGDAEDQNDAPPSFYEEAIQDFDARFDCVIKFLERTNRLEKTLIIFYSDHGWRHATKVRIPLIMRFPNAANAGSVGGQVQNIDIAPTILDYLDIPKPEWMEGESLLTGQIDFCDPIVSVWPIRSYDQQLKWKQRMEAKAPFYTLGAVSVVTCNRYFKYDLERRRLYGERITGADENCSQCEPMERRDVIRFIRRHLRENGYDISALE